MKSLGLYINRANHHFYKFSVSFDDNLHDLVSSLSQRCLNSYFKMELPESNNNF